MMLKGVKPRTHLAIDLFLFTLFATVAIAALLEHAASPGQVHLRFMFHAIHGVAGIAMFLVVGFHLLIHLPWITVQLRRLFQ